MLVAALAAPDARAGCGDYVVVGSRMVHADRDAAPPSPRPDNEPPRPACRGPSCSPAHLPPAPPPPATTPQQAEQWGCLVPAPVPTPGRALLCAPPAGPAASRGHADDVFHPPRSRAGRPR